MGADLVDAADAEFADKEESSMTSFNSAENAGKNDGVLWDFRANTLRTILMTSKLRRLRAL